MSMIGHNQQQRSVQGLTDEDRKILRKAVLEMNDSMTRVGAERAYYKANFKEEVQENTDFEEFYTTVMEKTAS